MAETSVPKALEGLTISKTKELKGIEKRDSLISIEKKYQQRWEEDRIFEPEAPSLADYPLGSISPEELRKKHPKFFATIAYPYMNGRLHVGHAFSFTKVEFAAGFAAMEGKKVLFPQGYHCTGLPIKACADKLAKEVEMLGTEFDGYNEADEAVVKEKLQPAAKTTKEDPTKFSSKKGKAAAKTVKMKYQFQIMQSLGIPKQEIHRFADPMYWLEFFPPLCMQDLQDFGCRIDWRRQFVTTPANPYYDAFVRWQMIRLKELRKIKFGKRYTIYSIKDGQPCMDHDRSEGEGVNPQEYTALKLKVLEWSPKAAKEFEGRLPGGAQVYLVPATLRPETMYGQTCCFVGPSITYGVYKAPEHEYFVITERAARNMAHQGIFAQEGVIEKVAEVRGSDIVGTLVYAPLSLHKEGVRALPMESVLPNKGTGVVTSVPSDSPDDYATLVELTKKADYYGIQKEWAQLEIFPIIDTPAYGDRTAIHLYEKLKIASPKDAKQLAEAKELAYKEGFYSGTMKVGEFKGEKVVNAKPKLRQYLIDSGEAFAYAEPEGRAVSRSGDECTVALMDQWYLDYGEVSWKETALEFVENKDGGGLNCHGQDTQHAFIGVLNWLNQWSCARTYGLGSKIPWDDQFLVESLSDSTIYMSYYTIAHFLHSDRFGTQQGCGKIAPEQMVDEVFDYVFARTPFTDELVTKSKIPKETLHAMRRSFEYWYPLDLRFSGKDLIPNHLTFCIYNHIALFPRQYWLKGIRANGHLMLNGEKMSKSTGNFLTLNDTVQKYGADAARIALADAGDGISDANFEEDVADSNILRLYTNKEWCKQVVREHEAGRLRSGGLNSFQDALFDNEMNTLVRETRSHYGNTNYKLALKTGWFDFISVRDFYRESCTAAGIAMHGDLVLRYIELQALMLAVIAPHWSDYIWVEVLKKSGCIRTALFPEVPVSNTGLTAQREYVRVISSNINSAEAAQLKRLAKGKGTIFDPKKPKKLTIFTTPSFPTWQAKYIDLMKEMCNSAPDAYQINDKVLSSRVAKMGETRKAMPFVQSLKRRLKDGEPADVVLERKLAFDENATLVAMAPGLKRSSGLVALDIVSVQEGSQKGTVIGSGQEVDISAKSQVTEGAVPGQPTFFFENVEA